MGSFAGLNSNNKLHRVEVVTVNNSGDVVFENEFDEDEDELLSKWEEVRTDIKGLQTEWS